MKKILFPTIKFERWKFNDTYGLWVSTEGHFKNAQQKPARYFLNKSGYVMIKTQTGACVTAHRIVMQTWNPTADMDQLTIDHLDHNKRNNAVANLEWVTEKENLTRASADLLINAVAENALTLKQAKTSIYDALKALWSNSASIRSEYKHWEAFKEAMTKNLANGKRQIYGMQLTNTQR